MFGKGITLFRLFGFEVRADLSWLLLAALITWSLAQGVFPSAYAGLSAATYWVMGVVGALGIFASIVIHEFSHSLVARRYGMRIRRITLFIFGGVAQMEEEPGSPRAELNMSIVGPLSSVAIGFLCWGVLLVGRNSGWPVSVLGVLAYLRTVNFILAGFNILPAFPLDGGRVLRAALWRWKGRLRWATRVASSIGSGFGIALMVVGFFFIIFRGAFISGMWWVLIGLFLRGASRSSYQKMLMTETLHGEPVSRFMKTDVVTVERSVPVESLVEDYIYKHHFKLYPVVDDGLLKGCVTTRQVKEVPREEWGRRTVGEIAEECSEQNTVFPDTDATVALSRMNANGVSRLMVVEADGRLAGIITLKDLMRFLSLKMDLEEDQVRRIR